MDLIWSHDQFPAGLIRPSKVVANAFRAGVHITAHRALPLPVESSDRVTRYTHFIAAWSLGKWPRARTARRWRAFRLSIAFVEQMVSSDLDVVVQGMA